MTLKNRVALLAIAPRRRVIATAFVYGLSLAVRFTSAVGEQAEIPPLAIMKGDATIISMASRARSVPLYLGWPVASTGCRAGCGSAMPMSPNCSSPP
jgi:hypothetical protein